MRRAPSWCQPLQEISVPLGARMVGACCVSVMHDSFLRCDSVLHRASRKSRARERYSRRDDGGPVWPFPSGARRRTRRDSARGGLLQESSGALLYDALILEVLRGDVLGVLLLDSHLAVELPHRLSIEALGDGVQNFFHLRVLLQDVAPDDGG